MFLFSYEHLRIQVKILEEKLESLGGKVFKSLNIFLTFNSFRSH